jgi:hypothetical protein
VLVAAKADVPTGRCLLCDGPITAIHRVGHWSEYGGGGGFWFSGSCEICDIDFRLSVRNGVFGEWQSDAPHPRELKSLVGEEELVVLGAKFMRYPTLGPKWQSFLGRRRAEDEVWRFGSANGLHNGFALVRCGRPVSRFAVLGPMWRRITSR